MRRNLAIAVAAAAALSVIWALSQRSRPPHVVFIVVDTLRADRMSAYGFPQQTSPRMDEMAREGVRFARVVSQAPWTRPSIGSMLTGLYPRTIGLYEEHEDILDDEFTTLAEAFDAAGWRTIGATANPNINEVFNFHQGFDHYVDSTAVWRWMDAKKNQTKVEHTGLPDARDRFDQVLEALDNESPDEADQPHFLFVDIMEVHGWARKDLVPPGYRNLFPKRKDRTYLQLIRAADDEIGRFVDRLMERPGWDDVLVVIVSDHGEGLQDHRAVPHAGEHGWVVYSSNVEVPWIMWRSGAGLPRGRVVPQAVRVMDVMPTVLDLVGLGVPWGLDGVSVVDAIEGGTVALPDAFFVETHYRDADKVGLHTEDFVLVENKDQHPNTHPVELHRREGPQNGERSDIKDKERATAEALFEQLRAFEEAHPPRPPTRKGEAASSAERRQLKALGYID